MDMDISGAEINTSANFHAWLSMGFRIYAHILSITVDIGCLDIYMDIHDTIDKRTKLTLSTGYGYGYSIGFFHWRPSTSYFRTARDVFRRACSKQSSEILRGLLKDLA